MKFVCYNTDTKKKEVMTMMEPTNAEIIFYAVIAVVGLVMLLACAGVKDNTIEMTWTKKRDIARVEKSWYK